MSLPDKPDFSDVRTGSSAVPAHPDFSDVQTGSSVVQGSGGTGARTYTVVQGDTLSDIAHRVYGRASRWHAIYDANRNLLDNPDRILPGQVLTLPDLDDSHDGH